MRCKRRIILIRIQILTRNSINQLPCLVQLLSGAWLWCKQQNQRHMSLCKVFVILSQQSPTKHQLKLDPMVLILLLKKLLSTLNSISHPIEQASHALTPLLITPETSHFNQNSSLLHQSFNNRVHKFASPCFCRQPRKIQDS